MSTQLRGENTRERILSAAEALVLARGFSGTSIDDILKVTGLTKGAFFHHFRSKSEMARALVEQWVERDLAMLAQLSGRADELAEDPLQAALLFIRLIEEIFENLDEPFPGCMLASYVYESELFEGGVNAFVAQSFRDWVRLYEEKFDRLVEARQPAITVTAKELAEEMACLLEGAFILARAYGDRDLIVRQSRLFRRKLQLLFDALPRRQETDSETPA